MKKFFLLASVALLTLAASSCTGGAKEGTDKGEAIKAKIENCTNPDSLKIYVKEAQDFAQKLLSEGKDAEAQAYLEQVKPAVAAKDPSMLSIFTAEADSAATAIKEAAQAKADSVAAKASEAKDSIASKAAKATEAVKDAAKDAAKGAADKASDAAKDAAKSAADKVKNALN